MPDTRFDVQALFDVRGRIAVITGGGGVLGSVMARALAEVGARVAVISLHATSSAKVVETIRATGGEALGIACDVMDKAALEQAREEVLRNFTSIDILINAAGAISHKRRPPLRGPFLTWMFRLLILCLV